VVLLYGDVGQAMDKKMNVAKLNSTPLFSMKKNKKNKDIKVHTRSTVFEFKKYLYDIL
jgi:glutathione peroxidase-family protein